MKKQTKKTKYFNNNEEYFRFLEKVDIKIISVEYTRNFKIKEVYVII